MTHREDKLREAIGAEIDVLDHGTIRLIDFMGSDLSIIRAARLSHNAVWRTGKDDANDKRLMRRLWRGDKEPETPTPLPPLPKHSTPFEAVTLTFEIMAPIFVFRQWHRHRTQSYNEVSARYTALPEQYYLPSVEVVGWQDPSNKQGRITGITEGDTPNMYQQRELEIEQLDQHCKNGFTLYKRFLETGWPRELARLTLGMGTYSHMFATMNLLNFFKFANLRADAHAQYEIRVYAEAMLDIVEAFCSEAVELFREANAKPF